ncbi:hypothetical protein [Kineococcus sp. SYSU DK006]|uniref:hypothetical protein n=1 Tax=Kineococcus sp. SYSU DK006 TaxID=3383127 RepID=UPI003D7EB682
MSAQLRAHEGGHGTRGRGLEVDRRSVTKVVAALGLGATAVGLSGSVPPGPPPGAAADAGLDPTGTTDSAPALQALYDQGVRAVSLEPRGRYLLDTPVFLDDDDPFDCLVVFGNGAQVQLGARLARTEAFTADPRTRWAFFPNTRRRAFDGDAVRVDVDHRATGDAVGGTPRLVVHQLLVDGQGENRALAFFNRCSGRFNDVVMTAARTLVSWFDYCDAMVLDHCQARLDEVGDAWLLYQVSNGDGIVVLSPKTERSIGAASLQDCKGATIVSAISGRIRITRSRAVSILAGHSEGDLRSTSAYVVRSSQVTIDSSLVYPARTDEAPGIVVDDSDEGLGSEITLRDVGEMVFHRDGSSTVAAERQGDVVAAPMVSLVNVQPSTRVVAERVHTRVGTRRSGSRWLPSAGFRVTSEDADVAACLDAAQSRWQLACGSWELAHRDGWRVLAAGGSAAASSPALRAPDLFDVRGSVDGVRGSLGGSGLEYVAALRDAEGNHTEMSERVGVSPGPDGSVRLRLRTSGPGVLVVWRRRGEGVAAAPEVTASISAPGPEVTLYDTGGHLGGVPWNTDVRDVPATVAAVNTTRDVLLLSGRPVAQLLPTTAR